MKSSEIKVSVYFPVNSALITVRPLTIEALFSIL